MTHGTAKPACMTLTSIRQGPGERGLLPGRANGASSLGPAVRGFGGRCPFRREERNIGANRRMAHRIHSRGHIRHNIAR